MKIKCEICGKLVDEDGLIEHQMYSKKCWKAKYSTLLDTPGSKMKVICLCGCGRTKEIRKVDFKRGWGMFFSKSCKAKYQERNTGQFNAYMRGEGVSHAAKRRGEDPGDTLKYYTIHTVNGVEVDYPYDYGLTDQEWDDICASAEMGWDAHKDLL